MDYEIKAEDWTVSIFSYIYFKCLKMRGRRLKSWNLKWLSQLVINWFSSSVEARIIVVEYDIWIKMNVNVLSRRLITYIIRL